MSVYKLIDCECDKCTFFSDISKMTDSASESDSNSLEGGASMLPPSPVSRDQLQKRIESLQQQNRQIYYYNFIQF